MLFDASDFILQVKLILLNVNITRKLEMKKTSSLSRQDSIQKYLDSAFIGVSCSYQKQETVIF